MSVIDVLWVAIPMGLVFAAAGCLVTWFMDRGMKR